MTKLDTIPFDTSAVKESFENLKKELTGPLTQLKEIKQYDLDQYLFEQFFSNLKEYFTSENTHAYLVEHMIKPLEYLPTGLAMFNCMKQGLPILNQEDEVLTFIKQHEKEIHELYQQLKYEFLFDTYMVSNNTNNIGVFSPLFQFNQYKLAIVALQRVANIFSLEPDREVAEVAFSLMSTLAEHDAGVLLKAFYNKEDAFIDTSSRPKFMASILNTEQLEEYLTSNLTVESDTKH